MSGWIKIHRKIEDWEWYKDTNTFRLFFHMLLTANFEEKQWQGEVIKRGERIASRENISKEINLSVKQIRLCEEKLTKTGSLVVKTTNKFTKYIIVKYEEYQINESIEGNQKANEGQSKGNQRATTKEYKNKRTKEYNSDFEAFWKIYPRKDGSKQQAFKIYQSSLSLLVTHEVIMKGVQGYISHIKFHKTEEKHIAHATTWLNQARWESDYSKPQQEKLWRGNL